MPSTHDSSLVATAAEGSPVPPWLLGDSFAALPDPRSRQGRRFTLAALLTLALAAMLANHLSPFAIAAWGAGQDAASKRAMGFAKGVTPHQSTFQRLFRRLDPAALSAALTDHGAANDSSDAPVRGGEGVAIDGKAQCGRLAFATTPACPVHALTACTHASGMVLAQEEIIGDADKGEAELTVAPRLLARLDWRGRVLTGDALFCQRNLCGQVRAAGGERERSEPIVIVKENQPQLHRDIATLFASRTDTTLSAASLPAWDMREAGSEERGHGRQEQRRLTASTELNDYLDWPGVAQVLVIERVWWERGARHAAVRYAITSLPPAVADAARLLVLVRDHWQIENGLHYVKDVTLGEDRSLIHKGNGPSIMAILRDTVVSVLHRAGWRTIAARLRYYSGHPKEVLALLGVPMAENA
jgi:predicted transposase YbfD/YdcC